jgi:hypothetical protein
MNLNVELSKDENGRNIINYHVPSKFLTDEMKDFILQNPVIKFTGTRSLSIDQMKLIYVLFAEYDDFTFGETFEGHKGTDSVKKYFKAAFGETRGLTTFSLSPNDIKALTVDQASDFIQFIIDAALKNNFNLIIKKKDGRKISVREIYPDISRWVRLHIFQKKCAICSTTEGVELHHWHSVASIGGYESCDGLKTPFMSLCGKHHAEIEYNGQKEFQEKYINNNIDSFNKKYHIEGVWLNYNMIENLLKVYPGQFKLHRKNKKNKI